MAEQETADPVEEAVKALRENFGRIGILSRAVVHRHPTPRDIIGVILDSLASTPGGRKVLLSRALTEEEREALLLATATTDLTWRCTPLRSARALLFPGGDRG